MPGGEYLFLLLAATAVGDKQFPFAAVLIRVILFPIDEKH